MDYNALEIAVQSRRAVSELERAIVHISSRGFMELPLDDQLAHAAAYRSRFPGLVRDLPNNPQAISNLYILRNLLEGYE